MGIRARLRRLQAKATADRGGACPECGGLIPIIERDGDETRYPFEEPCGLCEDGPGVRFIEVMLREDDGN